MKKILALTAVSLCSTPAMAGIYANVESNTSYSGGDYQSRATDLHVGFENTAGILDWYAQGGKTINAVDGADSDSAWSGKVGGSVSATDKLGVYGEFSFANIADEETDNTYGTKLGAKFAF